MNVTASAYPTGHPGYTETLPCEEASARAARKLVRTALTAWKLGALADDSSVIVSELVANCLKHTASRNIRVTVSRPEPGWVRVAVVDKAPRALPTAADAAVSVLSSIQAVTGWSRRYFGPWWNAVDVAPESVCAAPLVVADVDAQQYADAALAVTQAPHTSTTYAKAHTLVARHEAEGSITAVSPDEALAYRSEPATGRLTIVGCDTEPVAAAAARLAREAMRGVLLRSGWSVLHASAVALDGRVVLALGSKGAGKTTSAVALAARHGWELLANDRVFVRVNAAGGVNVLSWPSAAALGLGLLDALGWFDVARERLEAGEALHPTQDQRVTDALVAGRREPLWDGKRELKAQVFPDQFPTWFGLGLATGGQAAALLFPRIEPGAGPAMEEAGRTVGEGDFMSGKTEDRYPDVFELARVDGGGTADVRQAVGECLANLPHHSVVLGHDLAANADFLVKVVAA